MIERWRTPLLADEDFGMVDMVRDPQGDWVNYGDLVELLSKRLITMPLPTALDEDKHTL